MATNALYNFLKSKSRDTYTQKGSVDEIQSKGTQLQEKWRENSPSKSNIDLERAATEKRNLNAKKFRT